jgi:hypothetical protein
VRLWQHWRGRAVLLAGAEPRKDVTIDEDECYIDMIMFVCRLIDS